MYWPGSNVRHPPVVGTHADDGQVLVEILPFDEGGVVGGGDHISGRMIALDSARHRRRPRDTFVTDDGA